MRWRKKKRDEKITKYRRCVKQKPNLTITNFLKKCIFLLEREETVSFLAQNQQSWWMKHRTYPAPGLAPVPTQDRGVVVFGHVCQCVLQYAAKHSAWRMDCQKRSNSLAKRCHKKCYKKSIYIYKLKKIRRTRTWWLLSFRWMLHFLVSFCYIFYCKCENYR